MSRKHLWILVVSVLAIVAISAGAVDAAKGGKPGKPPPEPDPSANPEIVCDLRIKNKGYLAVMDADGSNVTPLYSGSAHWGTWSPDGQYIAVKNNVNPRYQLWRMDADGSNPEYLTHPITDRPRWSPAPEGASSHDLIAYVASYDYDVMVIDAFGGTPSKLLDATIDTDPDYGYYWSAPTWSPDGSRLAALRLYEHGSRPDEVVIVDSDDPESETVLGDGFTYLGFENLAWARQHDWLALFGTRDGVRGTYVLDIDTGDATLAVEEKYRPTWSQDDSKLVTMSLGYEGACEHLYVYTFADASLEDLGCGTFPEWKRCVTDPDTGVCEIPGP